MLSETENPKGNKGIERWLSWKAKQKQTSRRRASGNRKDPLVYWISPMRSGGPPLMSTLPFSFIDALFVDTITPASMQALTSFSARPWTSSGSQMDRWGRETAG